MVDLPENEAQRLEALRQANILDTPPEEGFDDLTRLAAFLCEAPIAAISLIDTHRQWFKSTCGLGLQETPREIAFCAHTILQREMFIVPDTLADERFAQNPLVIGEPHIRFYAGAPLITAEGFAVGSLCVIDQIPRQLTEKQIAALQMLSRQATSQIELTKRVTQQQQMIEERRVAEEILQQSQNRLLEAQQVAKIGSWEYDVATGQIAWSDEMFRLLGFDPLLGEPNYETLLTHYHPDDVSIHDAMVIQALNDGLPYHFDIRTASSEGPMRWVHAKGQAARDEAGRIVRLFGTVMDITERKQAEEENGRLAAIIASSDDAVLGLTFDGTLVSWNESAERLYGYTEGEIIGQHVSVLAPPEQRADLNSFVRDLQCGEYPKSREVRSRLQNGTCLDTLLSFSPIRNPAGEVVGLAAIGRDITLQRAAEEAVRRSEARLAEAQRVARIGSWEVDSRTGEIIFSHEMYNLFELDVTAGMPPLDQLLAKYHPDDVEKHTAIVARSQMDGQPFTTDVRIVRADGTFRWCHIVGEPIRDPEGRPLRLIGTMIDVTDRVLVEERFRVLFECSSEAHFLWDAGGIIDCNQAALQMLRCPDKASILSAHPAALSPERQPDGRLSSEKSLEMALIATQAGGHRFEWTHRKMDGEDFPVEVVLRPVVINEKPAMLFVWHDLTERKLAEQRIRDYAVILEFQKQELELANRELCDLATIDGLTGLKNHRTFQERLQTECETAVRHQTPLSLLLLDVDHFKQFNDAFGHPAGDAVLKQVARLLEQMTRDCDFVGRYGGEEFVVILPQTDQVGALRAAERCRLAIETTEWSCRPVTASFGIATVSLQCTGSPDLIAAADQALYAAKSNGRNQVMQANSFFLAQRQEASQVQHISLESL